MLRWTTSGAVAAPATVQIRLTPSYLGRVVAGAPLPARALTHDELLENLYYFVKGRVGPRTRGCDAVVLSGLDDAEPDALASALADARRWGLRRAVVHAGTSEGALVERLGPLADVLVRVISSPGPAVERAGAKCLHLAVPLRRPVLDQLDDIVDRLIARPADLVVLTWPYPGGEPPPVASECAPRVGEAICRLAEHGMDVGLKGLPVCLLSPEHRTAARSWRSGNRWYVDAEHQKDDALLFFPQVVQLTRPDSCRFCVAAGHCDGVAEEWYDAGLVGCLEPIRT